MTDELEAALREIAEYAHDRSTGPTVPDALWEVRAMAYAALESAPAPQPAVPLDFAAWLENAKALRKLLSKGDKP